LEIYVNAYTPWNLWDFLYKAERVEILYHSIHYVDLARHLLGEPHDIYAVTTRHPHMQQLQEVRSNIILDYGNYLRVNILTNHVHSFGQKHQDAYIKIEGTKGAVKIGMGLLVNYPHGTKDTFELITKDSEGNGEWQSLPVNGSWFPHAFIGSMGELIKTKNGEISLPNNTVEDCIETMRLVEVAYNFKKRVIRSAKD
jgi:predicted dehydrogenase